MFAFTALRSGTLALAAVLPVVTSASAGTLTVLHSFIGATDGSTPFSLKRASDGTLFGNTFYGPCATSRCSTVFRLDTSGTLTTLKIFDTVSFSIGIDNHGDKLFGVTDALQDPHKGAVFAMLDDGSNFHLLHRFVGPYGRQPEGKLLFGPGGVIYGITYQGSRHQPGAPRGRDPGVVGGALYALKQDGGYRLLHAFSDRTQGDGPNALFADDSGTLFGSTDYGGTSDDGVVFSYSASAGYKVLYNFTNIADGEGPELGGMDAAGNLYGATIQGGDSIYGTLFNLVKSGSRYTYHRLISFSGDSLGVYPLAPLVLKNGTIYGVTEGQQNVPPFTYGTIYSIKSGHVVLLHTFSGGADGAYPQGNILRDSSENLYGTTSAGGAVPCPTPSGGSNSRGCGVIWRYSLGE